MLTFHCRPLLVKEADVSQSGILPKIEPESAFDSWCIHRFYREQDKYWLFVHSDTFFSFTIKSALQQDLKDVLTLFTRDLAKILFYEEFSAGEIAHVLQSLEGPFRIEGNISKGMQKSVEVLAGHYRWFVERAEQLSQKEPESVCLHVNETPLEMLSHRLPAELFRLLVEQTLGGERKAA